LLHQFEIQSISSYPQPGLEYHQSKLSIDEYHFVSLLEFLSPRIFTLEWKYFPSVTGDFHYIIIIFFVNFVTEIIQVFFCARSSTCLPAGRLDRTLDKK